MSKEMKENVQVVMEPKQENSKATSNAVSVGVVEPPILNIDLKSMDSNLLKTAESFGIPLNAILKYVSDLQNYNISVEARLRAIVANFEPAVKETVNKMVQDAAQQQQQKLQAQQAQAPGPAASAPASTSAGLINAIPQIMPILQNLGITGQTVNDPFAAMAKEWFMEEMTASRAFKKQFDAAVLAKLGSKMASDVAGP